MQLKHVKGLKRIGAMNRIACQLLAGTVDARDESKGLSFSPVWDFSVALEHSTVMYFPVLQLKRKK